eukprot:NODE_62_length_25126_cov_0.447277.p6 type:complete len:282 gc:universal NODE_62_length_25126_cov_0.447277:22690-21845(-)
MESTSDSPIPTAYPMLTQAEIDRLNLIGWFGGYYPDLNLCYMAIGVFAFLTIAITIRNMRYKYYYMYILSFCGVGEILGYVGRVLVIQNFSKQKFIFMDVFLILIPLFMAFVEYKTLGKLMELSNIKAAFNISHKYVQYVFFASDVISVAVQGTGAAFLLMGNTSDLQTGKYIMSTGVALQMAFFTAFLAMIVSVQLKDTKKFALAYANLYFQMICLYARFLFRFVEFFPTETAVVNNVVTNEFYFYIFDFGMVAACFVSYIVFYFPELFEKDSQTHPVKE